MLRDYDLAPDAQIVHVEVAQEAADLSPNLPLTPIELIRHIGNIDHLRAIVSGLDVVVVNGGGYMNDLWARPHRMRRLLAILAPAVVAVEQGKTIHFTANGFGPFSESAEMFASLFARMHSASFTCRDALGSPSWLRRIGVAENSIYLAPDDLLLVERDLACRPSRLNIPTSKDYLVVETYRPVQELEINMKSLLALQDSIGAEVVLLPMNRAHGGEDQAEALSRILPNSHLYPISSEGYLPVEDALHLISGARLTVTDRYHGLVAALGLSAPVVSIIRPVRGSLDYYYRKNAGALEWRLAPGSYTETDFIALEWANVPSNKNELDLLVQRQTQSYAASVQHFDRTRVARMNMVERIFAA
nr:polysaccharide pyruvyl transferase family protein [Agrococcus sp. KRD186]